MVFGRSGRCLSKTVQRAATGADKQLAIGHNALKTLAVQLLLQCLDLVAQLIHAIIFQFRLAGRFAVGQSIAQAVVIIVLRVGHHPITAGGLSLSVVIQQFAVVAIK